VCAKECAYVAVRNCVYMCASVCAYVCMYVLMLVCSCVYVRGTGPFDEKIMSSAIKTYRRI